MLRNIIESKRSTKRFISVIYDSIGISLSLYLALALRLGTITPVVDTPLLQALAISVAATILCFIKLGLYRAILRFATIDAIVNVFIGVSVSAITLTSSSFFLETGIPRSTPIIFSLICFILLGAPRLLFRSLLRTMDKDRRQRKENLTPVIIYGAGYTGYQLAQALKVQKSDYEVVAFIDDDKKLIGSKIRNIQTYHSSQLDYLKERYNLATVLLALGKTPRNQKSEIIKRLEKAKLKTLTVPPIEDIISGKSSIIDIKPVAIEDLLGRDPVPANPKLLDACIKNKNVMITGAGGSIGSELCRQILSSSPTRLVLFELNEYNLYQIEQQLRQALEDLDTANKPHIISLIGSVQNQKHLETIMSSFKINTVYHAAAYKHVPIVEHNIIEGLRNNVFGTWFCAEAAINSGVESFVLISTDKAVRPTNIMGTTKRLAELVLQALAQRQNATRFTMVRFGNVLGSSGSVVPLFKKQIAEGGPLTVTHPEITRYFMTIPEAAELVIQAGSMGEGGDVFILDMGDPVKVNDLAQQMITLSGLSIKHEDQQTGDIEIQYTGIRPGEKLFEELLIGSNISDTEHPLILRGKEVSLTWKETEKLLKELNEASHEFDCEKIVKLLKAAPTGYEPLDKVIHDQEWGERKHLNHDKSNSDSITSKIR